MYIQKFLNNPVIFIHQCTLTKTLIITLTPLMFKKKYKSSQEQDITQVKNWYLTLSNNNKIYIYNYC